MEHEPPTVADGTTSVRGLIIDPWAKSVRSLKVPTMVHPCGCTDVCGVALANLLGRAQVAHLLPTGEVLLVSEGVSSPRWRWGSTEARGLGLVLSGDWAHALCDAISPVADVLASVEFVRQRRATAEAA